ncbi:MAG: DNA replication/repair protein RecF [bacterium]|nr:MAG: DNA replication/repair protein RecF [bacterium]
MVLKKLKLVNFRNYVDEEIVFNHGINILFGQNGQGKTNILESLYYLGLTKSFRTNNDQNLILNNAPFFRIEGEFSTDVKRKVVVSLALSLSEGKRLKVNQQKILKFSDYIGTVPLVLLAPSDLDISQGGPHRRRQFLDIMLSQSSRLYLHHLLQYRRSLKQRNLLLQAEGMSDPPALEAWEEALIQHGIVLIEKREEAVRQIDEMVKTYYGRLSGKTDKVKIVYQSSLNINGPDSRPEGYRQAMTRNREKDRQLQTTRVGPHRDDMLFLINGKPLRWMGSQGEHKTFIIALRMAEYQYLQTVRESLPLLLFDDIFGELDGSRIGNMIESLSRIGQVFITTTSPDFFGKVENWQGETSFYEIVNGKVSARELV